VVAQVPQWHSVFVQARRVLTLVAPFEFPPPVAAL